MGEDAVPDQVSIEVPLAFCRRLGAAMANGATFDFDTATFSAVVST